MVDHVRVWSHRLIPQPHPPPQAEPEEPKQPVVPSRPSRPTKAYKEVEKLRPRPPEKLLHEKIPKLPSERQTYRHVFPDVVMLDQLPPPGEIERDMRIHIHVVVQSSRDIALPTEPSKARRLLVKDVDGNEGISRQVPFSVCV
jgi:hypothetical protein